MSTINYTKEDGTISQYTLVPAAPAFSDFSDVPPPFGVEAAPPPQSSSMTPQKHRRALSQLSNFSSPSPSPSPSKGFGPRPLAPATKRPTGQSNLGGGGGGGVWGEGALVGEMNEEDWEEEKKEGMGAVKKEIAARIAKAKVDKKTKAADRQRERAAAAKLKKKGEMGAVDLEDGEGEEDEDMGEKPSKGLKRKAQTKERNLKKGKVARK
ncbi:hypothetical protein V8E51_005894 [Hyaloscypha variabilis]